MKDVFTETRMEGYAQGLELGQNVQSFIRFYCLDRYLDIFDITALAGEKARLDKLWDIMAEEGVRIQKKDIGEQAKTRYAQSYKTRLQFLEDTKDTVNVMLEAMRKEQYLPVFRHKKET